MTTVSEPGLPLGTEPDALDLPDRALFWRWVWSAVRPVLGWVLAALGALALFLGWYGVSGQALTAKQLPYVVSGGLTGVALILLACVFLVSEDLHRQLGRLDRVERAVTELHALLVEEAAGAELLERAPVAPVPRVDTDALVALPTGGSYHRAGCALVAGKAAVAPVTAAEAARRGLRPCRLCEPVLAA